MDVFVELWKNTQKSQKIHAKYGKKCAFLVGHNFVGIILCSDYATRHNIMLHYASRHNIMLCDYALMLCVYARDVTQIKTHYKNSLKPTCFCVMLM
jgi:hypothetical protein